MTRPIFVWIFMLVAMSGPAMAQVDVEFHEDRRHHFSALIGGSYIDAADETVFTLGIDYEYRVNRLLGVGFVAEQAFGDIDATTLLAVADIHVWRGLAFQIGPGVEFVDDETYAVGRFGALYEIELAGEITISPQIHYDFSEGEDAVVFGIAIGRAF